MPKNKKTMQLIIHEMSNHPHNSKIKKMIKEAITEGFDINTKYVKGKTLAHYVVRYNLTGLLSFLDKQGLNLNLCDDAFNTPLHDAVRLNRFQLVKELIRCGVDINLGGDLDTTPLHYAVYENLMDIVCLLVKDGGADYTLVDENNLSPVDYAAIEENDIILNFFEGVKKNESYSRIHS